MVQSDHDATPTMMPRPLTHGCNLRDLMRERLPDTLLARLDDLGHLARQFGVAAYVVGGLVRDLLLGRPTLDVDITVEGDGMAFARYVANQRDARLKIFPRFATAYVVFQDGGTVDIATARRENYAHPSALPTVAPTSITDDLTRRDFTINALAIALNAPHFGNLCDAHGGLRDLDKHKLRVLHDRSFVDDPTRLFRAIRFEQRCGFRLETRTRRLLHDAAATDLVQQLSGPRLRNELLLLLAENNPRRTIQRMAQVGLLRFVHPRLMLTPQRRALLAGIPPALAWWTTRFSGRAIEYPLIYFMALLEGLTRPAMDVVLTRLAFPNRQANTIRMVKARLATILRRLATHRSLRPSQQYRLLAGFPNEGFVLLAAQSGRLARRLLDAYLTTYQQVQPLLTGEDLKNLGLKPGPLYRKILDRLLDAKLNGVVRSKTDERAFVKMFVASQSPRTPCATPVKWGTQ